METLLDSNHNSKNDKAGGSGQEEEEEAMITAFEEEQERRRIAFQRLVQKSWFHRRDGRGPETIHLSRSVDVMKYYRNRNKNGGKEEKRQLLYILYRLQNEDIKWLCNVLPEKSSIRVLTIDTDLLLLGFSPEETNGMVPSIEKFIRGNRSLKRLTLLGENIDLKRRILHVLLQVKRHPQKIYPVYFSEKKGIRSATLWIHAPKTNKKIAIYAKKNSELLREVIVPYMEQLARRKFQKQLFLSFSFLNAEICNDVALWTALKKILDSEAGHKLGIGLWGHSRLCQPIFLGDKYQCNADDCCYLSFQYPVINRELFGIFNHHGDYEIPGHCSTDDRTRRIYTASLLNSTNLVLRKCWFEEEINETILTEERLMALNKLLGYKKPMPQLKKQANKETACLCPSVARLINAMRNNKTVTYYSLVEAHNTGEPLHDMASYVSLRNKFADYDALLEGNRWKVFESIGRIASTSSHCDRSKVSVIYEMIQFKPEILQE